MNSDHRQGAGEVRRQRLEPSPRDRLRPVHARGGRAAPRAKGSGACLSRRKDEHPGEGGPRSTPSGILARERPHEARSLELFDVRELSSSLEQGQPDPGSRPVAKSSPSTSDEERAPGTVPGEPATRSRAASAVAGQRRTRIVRSSDRHETGACPGPRLRAQPDELPELLGRPPASRTRTRPSRPRERPGAGPSPRADPGPSDTRDVATGHRPPGTAPSGIPGFGIRWPRT